MLGIIGGTGLYELNGLEDIQERNFSTPFGKPSSSIITAKLRNTPVAFLARHGKQHEYLPSEVPYRANIYALKEAGVSRIITVNAVGSLREELRPGDIVAPKQFIDFTKGIRKPTFFGGGLSAHISSADPVCPELSSKAPEAAADIEATLHRNATYVCVEGPRLGTRAESHMLRNFGADIVGMTAVPEVFLAREASLCYLSLCVVTDYDCWKEGESTDTLNVIENYKQSIEQVKKLLLGLLHVDPSKRACTCKDSLERALICDPEGLTKENRELHEKLS